MITTIIIIIIIVYYNTIRIATQAINSNVLLQIVFMLTTLLYTH